MGQAVILNQVCTPEVKYPIFNNSMESLKESLVYAPHVNVLRGSLLQLHKSISLR